MKTFIAFASMFLASLAFASPSQAQDEPKSRTVQFEDLDLSKSEDAAALFARIRGAAKSVCDAYNSRELIRHQHYIACVELAVSNAVMRVDEPLLTDYFASRSNSGRKVVATIANRR